MDGGFHDMDATRPGPDLSKASGTVIGGMDRGEHGKGVLKGLLGIAILAAVIALAVWIFS